MNRKILMSLGVLVFVVALSLGVTGAFFSDTETSTGNTFTAGDIDLQIDNESYVTDSTGALVASPETSWGLKDLVPGVDHFFDFDDLKPGDVGEDTISIHVGSNDAWMCAAARVMVNSDETCTDPEQTDETGNCVVETDGTNGDLASQLNFMFWHDDGDNVLEEGETPFLGGPLSNIGSAGQITLADSVSSILGQNIPIPGGTTFYIGKAWCFGALTASTTAQDRQGKLPGSTNGPLVRGTGVSCDGAPLNNISQTDKVQGDLQFYATQSRNNSAFTCSQNYTPTWPEEVTRATVGASLASYVDPTQCDVTATTTIQNAINTAVAGNTVCVPDGTFNEDVNVNKSISLIGSGATSTTIINGVTGGQTGAVGIAANNVTVSGFQINAAASSVAAMRFSANLSGATISFNKITSASGGGAVDTQGGQSNHTFSNNEFVGVSGSQLVYVNGVASVSNASTNVDFLNNTFSGSAGLALGQEANSSQIQLNKFSATTGYTDVEDWSSGNLINQNNFNDAVNADVIHSENVNTGDTGTTNAENNWWGDADPSDGDAGADVNFTPFEASAFPEN